MPTRQQAAEWLRRWEAQQDRCVPDRRGRFAVIADVVREQTGRDDPLIVDLATGPGSLAVYLLDRLPHARVVGIDADPLLLGLARAEHADRNRLRLVEHDLREPGWAEALNLDGPVDAFVSTTALHWLTGSELATVYRCCGDLAAQGGVLVNGDHLHDGPERPRIDALTRAVSRCLDDRAPQGAGEDWETWWRAAAAAPELADLIEARGPDGVHHIDNPATFGEHLRFLEEAGFTEAGTVWQRGDNRVLVAVR